MFGKGKQELVSLLPGVANDKRLSISEAAMRKSFGLLVPSRNLRQATDAADGREQARHDC